MIVNCSREFTRFGVSLILIFAVILPARVYADTRYVSDVLVITLREGQGAGFKVLTTLRSNTPLEVLEQDKNYLRVRTRQGIEGWVPARYIVTEPPKAIMIARLNRELAGLQKKLATVTAQNTELKTNLQATEKMRLTEQQQARSNRQSYGDQLDQTTDELRKLTAQYKTLQDQSKNVLELVRLKDELSKSNQTLTAQNKELKTAMTRLEKENFNLSAQKMVWWFLAGAAVIIVGFLIGKASRRRNYY